MEWKVIKNFEDYKVSNAGQVFSIKRNKLLKAYEKKGYYGVWLYQDKKRYFRMVHRLVATAFIPNTENLPQINHKDENSKNNNVENLEWCTAKYNSNYGNHRKNLSLALSGENNYFYGKHHTKETKEKMRLAKLGKQRKRKRRIVIYGVEYESITQAMEILGIGTKKIYSILKGDKL